MSNSESVRDQVQLLRENILQLIKSRNVIEQQIGSLGDILKSNHVGMKDTLTDAEGFPRTDIDVYQVRHARHQIICLQNDFKSLTKEIETHLERFHETAKDARNGFDGIRMEIDDGRENDSNIIPIVKVNVVSEGSPAFHAGLQIGDEILTFGSINSENFNSVHDIGNVVQRSQGKVLTVQVKRNGTVIQLVLIPGPWNGRGLLGCNILPIESVDH